MPGIKPFWRFNIQILNNPQGYEYLKQQIKFIFETNEPRGISPSLLWETFKELYIPTKVFKMKRIRQDNGR